MKQIIFSNPTPQKIRYNTPMSIKALIFDFDGLILDTETPDFASWQAVYQHHGVDLPVEMWASIVGGNAESEFDPHAYLEELTGQSIDRDEVWISRRKQYLQTVEDQPILPGVCQYLEDAKRLGLKVGVASSSPENWVRGHLTRIGLWDDFDCICTADDVVHTKPDPELFLSAARNLGVKPEETIVLEDSPNGALGAKRAGMYVVAVPNPFTEQLPNEHADLVLESLAELRLEALLEKVGRE